MLVCDIRALALIVTINVVPIVVVLQLVEAILLVDFLSRGNSILQIDRNFIVPILIAMVPL